MSTDSSKETKKTTQNHLFWKNSISIAAITSFRPLKAPESKKFRGYHSGSKRNLDASVALLRRHKFKSSKDNISDEKPSKPLRAKKMFFFAENT